MQRNLHIAGHCTMKSKSVSTDLFHNCFSSECDDNVPYCHVPNNCNYVSPDNSMFVVNDDRQDLSEFGFDSSIKLPIDRITQIATSMFEHGLEHYFKYDNRKRNQDSMEPLNTKTVSAKKKVSKVSKGARVPNTRKRTKSTRDTKSKKDTTCKNNITSPESSPGRSILHDNKSGRIEGTTMGLRLKPSMKTSIHASTTKSTCGEKRKRGPIAINATDISGLPVTTKMHSKALPCLSVGYTQSDCNKYGSNLSTIAGTVKPSKMGDHLPKIIREKLIEVVELVLKYVPQDSVFDVQFINCNKEAETRKMMMSELKEYLGGDSCIDHFRIEGCTILIPIAVGWHYDVMNCCFVGFDCVLSVNVNIPINNKTFTSGTSTVLHQWLAGNGYTKSFPLSFILYSRKVVGSFCKKFSTSFLIGERDLLRRLTHWALCERINKKEDYLSCIWNNKNFPKHFLNNCVKGSSYKKPWTFSGKCMKVTAAYDKMVSYMSFHLFMSNKMLLTILCD